MAANPPPDVGGYETREIIRAKTHVLLIHGY